jgi:lycopene cyclase domain-containing protein
MFGEWSYMAMLGFVLVASWWLEFAFKLRVLRNPRKLFTTLALVSPWFILWDAYAISLGHWFFDRDQMLGIIGPMNIPLEEYLFFILIPIASVLTLEGVTKVLPIVRGWLSKSRELVAK